MRFRRMLAAAVLVAVAGCTSDGSSPPPETSPPTAATSSAAPRTSAPAQPVTHSGPVVVRDATFISAQEGWVISDRQLLYTADGGDTWSVVGPLPAETAHVRFASAEVGYAWRPLHSLWITTDSGKTWHDGGLQQVSSIEIGGATAWALAGPLPGPHVWRSDVGSSSWKDLGGAPNREATLDVHGDTAYVMGQMGAGPVPPSLSVWTAGGGRRDEPAPCPRREVVGWTPLGVSTDGVVAVVCEVDDGRTSRQEASSSSDAGRTWSRIPGPPFAPEDVTATRRGVVAYGRDISALRDGVWHVVLRHPGHGRFSLVGFVDDDFGLAVFAKRELFRTNDGGTTWQPVRVSA